MSGKTYLYLEEDVDTLVVVGVEILVEVESEDDVDAELEELKGDWERLLNIQQNVFEKEECFFINTSITIEYQIGIAIPGWGELFEIEPFICIVISIYLDVVEMLDDVESEDDVDNELEVDTLKW